jgi:hypothetical protein
MRGIAVPITTFVAALASANPRFSSLWLTMGRVAATSVARIYADVNAKLGPSWHEYGEFRAINSVRHAQ